EILLATADLWKLFDRGADLSSDRLSVGTDLSQDGFEDAFLLLKHRCEHMLGLDLLVLIFLRDGDRFLNGLLAADSKSVESHIFILPQRRRDAENSYRSLRLNGLSRLN